MPRLTALERTKKQIKRASESVEDVVMGVQRMKETPGKAANRKIKKYLAGVQKAVQDGTVEAGNESYSLQQFQAIAIPKIRERYATGVAAAESKIQLANDQLTSFQQAIEDKIAAMPDDTPAQREARMLTNAREMAKFKLQRARV